MIYVLWVTKPGLSQLHESPVKESTSKTDMVILAATYKAQGYTVRIQSMDMGTKPEFGRNCINL